MINVNHRYYFSLFIICLLITFAFPAKGDDYVFNRLKIKDGLSQSTVFSITQDSKGFMWFGTRTGLNRYDGYNFLVYLNDPENKSSISDDGINSVFEDKDGIIWIGTTGGHLNRYDRKTDKFTYVNILSLTDLIPNVNGEFFEYPLSFSRNLDESVTSVIVDKQGFIWVGTWGKGLLRIDKNFKKINHFFSDDQKKNSLPSNRITKIISDSDGNIWAGTFGGGLSKISITDGNNFTFTNFISQDNLKTSLADNKVLTLFEDSDKNIWIGTFYGGLNLLTNNQKKLTQDKAIFKRYVCDNTLYCISNNTVMAIDEDSAGNIWIGTFGGGLNKLDIKSQQFTHYLNNPVDENSLADNDVLSLCIDQSGIIWTGSHLGAGITKIHRNTQKFNLIKSKPLDQKGLNDNVVWSVIEDENSNYWIGTYKGGINIFNKKNGLFKYITNDSAPGKRLSSNHVRVIKEDNYGNLWIGTYDGGLNLLNKKTFEIKFFKHDENNQNSLSADQIQDIFIDGDNTYWIGTFGGGLNKTKIEGNPFYSDIKFRHYINDQSNPASISDNRIYKIFKDNEGEYWIGTYGGGLNKFDPLTNRFIHYRNNPEDPQSLPDDNLMMVMQDSYGILWLGSYGGGLTSFKKKNNTFTRYGPKEGLTSNVVYGIIEDDNKNLWISSDDGLFKFNLDSKECQRYDIQDGLQSLEFSGGAYYKNNKGELFFGGINGLNYFNPDSIRVNTYLPSVVISSIKVFNEAVRGDISKLTLDYKKNFVTFEFSSLDYTDPQDNEYAYILEGVQDEWQYVASNQRMASYTNLSPGNYIFKVKGSNSDGIWSKDVAVVELIILPPFWQRWWFVLLIILAAGTIVYYFSTLRIKNLLAIEKLKSKLAADLHDNVGSSLTEISILSEVAAQRADKASNESPAELKKISEISRQLVDNMSDIVWVVNPKRDSLYDLIIKLKDSYGETLNSLDISFKTTNVDKLKNIKLPMEMKQNLYLLFKEAFNNAIKHSHCKRLVLETNLRNDYLEIALNDDGIGFNENDVTYGNGLKNIQERAKRIGGRIKIKSNAGEGTSIRFIGKFNRLNIIKTLIKK